jgi:bifunctional DNA-binding transcriptional regulator/antitoxin component of YhaV-PrlF toxin-antitoxin module
MTGTTSIVSAVATIQAQNQLTLPDTVVQVAEILEGDRFVVEVDPDDPNTVRLHRIRATYAGALPDVYGHPAEYLDAERATWE